MGRNGWSEWVREGECLIRSLRSSGVSGCPSEFSFMAAFFASAGDTLPSTSGSVESSANAWRRPTAESPPRATMLTAGTPRDEVVGWRRAVGVNASTAAIPAMVTQLARTNMLGRDNKSRGA
jgi:hypothetical protein